MLNILRTSYGHLTDTFNTFYNISHRARRLCAADALHRSRGGTFKFRAQCSESLASRPTSARPAACALAGGRPCRQNAILARGSACGGVPSLVRPGPSRHGPRHRPSRRASGSRLFSRRRTGGDPDVLLLHGAGRRGVSAVPPHPSPSRV